MVKFAWGRYKLFLCLVSRLWFSLFVKNKFLFWTTNVDKDNIYCDVKGKICNFLNKFLHETLFPHPSIILIAVGTSEIRCWCHSCYWKTNEPWRAGRGKLSMVVTRRTEWATVVGAVAQIPPVLHRWRYSQPDISPT